ncbi:DUF4232 domain-containing protein [Streptacidiphilus sp. P02-A3a]|uniref:DUF4232 domain-containing protein n=1 Tax=Streptacidiphilus sp. P02-A3a TaxID=2704468 RepID=UPI0015FD6CAB|nr:DUF4232 domain-containing protein [Streptacidiphilus sp. P02-A3a]QMU70512.1 DUF4232 domain-containing protein [Streptacidiphilus sp. P02-A3a]
MQVFPRKSVGLSTVLAALVVAGSAGTAAAAAPSSAPQRCQTTAVSVSLRALGDQEGLGNRGEDLVLSNTSHRTCDVYGYPGLGLQNAEHQVLPIKVVWGSTYFAADPRPHTITLKPGQSAYADVAWHMPYGTTSVTPSYLEVTPPNDTTHATIRFAPGAIDDDSILVTALTTHPLG